MPPEEEAEDGFEDLGSVASDYRDQSGVKSPLSPRVETANAVPPMSQIPAGFSGENPPATIPPKAESDSGHSSLRLTWADIQGCKSPTVTPLPQSQPRCPTPISPTQPTSSGPGARTPQTPRLHPHPAKPRHEAMRLIRGFTDALSQELNGSATLFDHSPVGDLLPTLHNGYLEFRRNLYATAPQFRPWLSTLENSVGLVKVLEEEDDAFGLGHVNMIHLDEVAELSNRSVPFLFSS